MQPLVWQLRFTWYKKPFALLLSPYQRTIWMDLDCQVRGSIEPMFVFCENREGFSAAAEHSLSQGLNLQRGIIKSDEKMYNAGVIVYKNDSKIIKEWTEHSKDRNHIHCSDQQVLSEILNSSEVVLTTLPSIYNWLFDQEFNSQSVIFHMWGDKGKEHIKSSINFLTQKMLMNFTFDDVSQQ